MNKQLAHWWEDHKDQIIHNLSRYVAIDTCSPKEGDAIGFLKEYLGELGFEFQFHEIPDSFFDHNEKCPAPVSHLTKSKKVMRAYLPTCLRKGRHLLVNAHVDVVPLQESFLDGFRPKIFDDRMVGRGCVDTKGNLVMFIEALRYMRDQNIPIDHDITIDLVSEEEIGGNGALASTLLGSEADCCLVLEPTELEVFGGHRGCVSFKVRFEAGASHMGDEKNARFGVMDVAADAIQSLRGLEAKMNKDKNNDPAFSSWSQALQINVGTINGGDWLGSTASSCEIAGNCGFLPIHGMETAKENLLSLFEKSAAKLKGCKYHIEWPALRNETYQQDENDPFVKSVLDAVGQTGLRAWNVSCDGRHYARNLHIPTLVFGCGELHQAHAQNETLYFSDFLKGIEKTIDILSSDLGGGTSEK